MGRGDARHRAAPPRRAPRRPAALPRPRPARSSCRGPRPRCAGSAACPRRPATPRACSPRGTLVMTFPEGGRGTGPGYARRYRLERLGHGGFVELALRSGAPIVPVRGRRPAGPGSSTACWRASRACRARRVPLPVPPAPARWRIALRRAAARRPATAPTPPRTARSSSSWAKRSARACRRRCTTASSTERERCDGRRVQLAQGVPGGHGPDLLDDERGPRHGARSCATPTCRSASSSTTSTWS